MPANLNQVSFTSPYAAEQMDIMRRQKLAEALQAQGMAPMGGTETAPGGWAIKRSPMEGLGKVAQQMSGAYLGRKASEDARGLGERYQSGLVNALREYGQQKAGTPAQTIQPDPQEAQQSADYGTPPVGPAQVPAMQGNPQGAAMGAMSSQYPALQQIGAMDYQHALKAGDPFNLREGEKRFVPAATGGVGVVASNPKTVQPKEHVIEGRVYQTQPDGSLKPLGGPGKPVDYNKPFMPTGEPNEAYQKYAQNTARAGATSVTVDNKAEGAYAGKVAGEAGEADRGQFKAAQASVENLHKIDTVLNHLKTSDAKTGLGAELLLNVERAKTFLGAGSKTVSDTELLDTMLGSEVFPMIQTLGIGARGMDTPAEREFLRKVMAGTITLNKETLVRMTEMRKDIAQRTLDNFNKRVDSGELDRFFKYSGMPKQKLKGPTPKRRADDKVPPAPAGITQQEWNAMRPEDRALWK